MKIENKMEYNRVKEALIRWVLVPGGQVFDVIPWSKEIESVIPWKDVCDEIDKSFGSRTDENNKWWDIGVILTNSKEYFRFDNFISLKTKNVMKVYQGIIDRANRLCNTRFEISVHKFIGVKNNVAQYEPIYRYFGNNLTSLANEVYDKLKVSDWENDDFIDSVHYGLYKNCRTVFKSNHLNGSHLNGNHLHLEVKKNS
jgi:hypothetical protein